ncbi:CD209 antigen-like protein E [Channa argus]|uniref:CD209 antigen-like protein E n=1 Tax=Channa argus TaxID=215402 RepID=UPI00351F99A9
MSTEIHAAAGLSVKYTTRVCEDRRKIENMEGKILINGEQNTDAGPQNGESQSEKKPRSVKRSFPRLFTVSLVVLYILILAGIIIRYVLVTLENDQLQTRYNSLRNMYNQSQNHLKEFEERITDMSVNNSQLQDEVKQLKNKPEDMSISYSRLQAEMKQLKDQTEGKLCPRGWKRFGCSCYFKSTEKKTWSDSRRDCEKRGSDLVIINSKEEQKFVTEMNLNGDSWIGLMTKQTSRGWTWEWVDRSSLTDTFWAKGQQHSTDRSFAACCDQQGKWTQIKHYYNYHSNWMCEK